MVYLFTLPGFEPSTPGLTWFNLPRFEPSTPGFIVFHTNGIRTFDPWVYFVSPYRDLNLQHLDLFGSPYRDFLTTRISGFHPGGPGSTPVREYISVIIFRESARQNCSYSLSTGQGFILGGSHSRYRAKGVEGFRLDTAQELFLKCVYLGFEIPHRQVSICFGILIATVFLKESNQVCGMPTSKDIDDGKVATYTFLRQSSNIWIIQSRTKVLAKVSC